MATKEEVVQRLKESRPPATDTFTYLTIIEKSLSPAILPDLNEILEDGELTKDIGWDLVEMLITLPGSEACLETIARLGNPREVILKALEAMESLAEEEGDDAQGGADEDDSGQGDVEGKGKGSSANNKKFVTLAGMLSILHKRLQVKSPSRFLETTLQSVCTAYNPRSPDQTAAIIDLMRSLSQQKRPPLPTRKSSTTLATPFQGTDPSKAAPDPEADADDAKLADGEAERVNRLLQAFMATVIEAFTDANGVGWASRLLEYMRPERIVPGKMTAMRAYKEVDELQARDALMGQLAVAASDLGLSKTAYDMLASPNLDTASTPPHGIEVSLDGAVCLTAYHMFASQVFESNYDIPDMHIFPQHHDLLKKFLGDEPQAQISGKPGTAEALVAMAVYLDDDKISGASATAKSTTGEGNAESAFMSYHHLITLISVFHPDVRVRNAATVVAGRILHADPAEDDRLAILEDLLENCMFSSLQACAVTWLREEIVATQKANAGGRFADPECFDKIQYSLFPDLTSLEAQDVPALVEFWAQNWQFHLQVANFARFLFGGETYKHLVPAGLAAAVEHRYVGPLQGTVKKLTEEGSEGREELGAEMTMHLQILGDTLDNVPLQ